MSGQVRLQFRKRIDLSLYKAVARVTLLTRKHTQQRETSTNRFDEFNKSTVNGGRVKFLKVFYYAIVEEKRILT
jgi:hypothetical protein